jgi:hypothetical protein
VDRRRLGPSTLARISSIVAGNPLYLCEVLDSAQRTGSLVRDRCWRVRQWARGARRP